LKKFVNYVVAGLAGTTPVMMSGSISALTAIVVEFKGIFLKLNFCKNIIYAKIFSIFLYEHTTYDIKYWWRVPRL
jgi:hypothetical protein